MSQGVWMLRGAKAYCQPLSLVICTWDSWQLVQWLGSGAYANAPISVAVVAIAHLRVLL